MSQLPPWQFRIAEGKADLSVGPGLVSVALSGNGAPAGQMIGFPIDLETRRAFVDGDHLDLPHDDTDALMEAVYDRIAGRFLVHLTLNGSNRLYLDATGQVPCVYDREAKVAGASPLVVVGDDAYDARFDSGLFNRMGIERAGYLPAGLTCHSGVARLLPNHYLDLSTFTPTRHWPTEEITETTDPIAEVDSLIATVRAQIEALQASDRIVAQALTAGRETRMLLGCAKPFLDKLEFVTVAGNDQYAVDTTMSQRIAGALGLNHRLLAPALATADERARYLRLNGHTIADANANTFPSVRPLAERHVFVGGAGGEIGRGFFWSAAETPSTQMTGAALVQRMGLPPEPSLISAMDGWLADVPLKNMLHVLDLAYMEHRMGPWGGAQFVSDPTLVRFAPLITRRTALNMIRLPESWKRSERMAETVIAKTWPEIDAFPYNTLGKFQDALIKVRRVLSDPSIIMRKIRKAR